MRRTSWALALLLLGGCRSSGGETDQGAELKSLAADPTAHNVALLTSGLNKEEGDAEESKAATDRLRKILKTVGGSQPFEIREYQEATKEELLQYTEQAARDVGSKGTLVWYVATHGWSDGFEMKSGRVHAEELEAALRKGREGKGKLRRMMMMFDYCGSGGTVGEFKLTDEVPLAEPDAPDLTDLADTTPEQRAALSLPGKLGQETFVEVIDQLADRLDGADEKGLNLAGTKDRIYQEAIFVSPVTKTQETIGQTLTTAMTNVVKEAKATRPNITIGQFLESTAKLISKGKTEDFFGDGDEDFELKKQKMVFRALPDKAVLANKLFD